MPNLYTLISIVTSKSLETSSKAATKLDPKSWKVREKSQRMLRKNCQLLNENMRDTVENKKTK